MGNRVHAPPTARGPVLGKIYKQAYSRIMDSEQPPKPVRWTGSSQKDLRSFPQPVRVATLCRSERRNRSCGQAAQKVLEAGASLRSWPTIVATLGVPSTPCVSRMRFTCCTLSRKNQSPVSPRRRRNLSLSGGGSLKQNVTTEKGRTNYDNRGPQENRSPAPRHRKW